MIFIINIKLIVNNGKNCKFLFNDNRVLFLSLQSIILYIEKIDKIRE